MTYEFDGEPEWLKAHRNSRPYAHTEEGHRIIRGIIRSRAIMPEQLRSPKLLADVGFNSHTHNDGTHVSPYDEGRLEVGTDSLKVELVQGVNEQAFKRLLSEALRATTGIDPREPVMDPDGDSDEMMRGGLQSALESQVIAFRVTGASRALTHQLVRSRKAAFHQQSQRATWYGDRPNVRMPLSIHRNKAAREAFEKATQAAWEAYEIACNEGISYQDARYALQEGTTNYILCEYSVREFINVFAYRGCSGFLWEMVDVMRQMRAALIEAHPFLEPHIKISCEKGEECGNCHGTGKVMAMDYSHGKIEAFPSPVASAPQAAPFVLVDCPQCKGIGSTRKCTFQGWENVEGFCDFKQAKQSNRTFLPQPRLRIGA